MSFTQHFKDGIRNVAYSTVTLGALLGAGCTQNHYHSYGNIPEKYSAKQSKAVKPVQAVKEEPVQKQVYPEPQAQLPEKETLRPSTLEEKVNDEKTGLPAGLIPGKDFRVNYNKNVQGFEIEGEFAYAGLKVGEYDPENRKTYLFCDGKSHKVKGPYISVGEQIIISAPKGKESPSVEFLVENGIINVEPSDFVVMQSNGSGEIVIAKRSGRIPKVTAKGDYTLFNGNQVLKFKDVYKTKAKGPVAKPNRNELPIDIASVGSSPMQVVTLDKDGKRVGTWDVIVDNYNQMKSVSESNVYNDIAILANGDVTSIYNDFHRLSPEEQRKLVQRQEPQQAEIVPAPLPEQIQPESRDISWKETPKQKIELPEFSRDGSSASFKGENYSKVPGSNKYVSPSGKYFLVD